MGREVKRVPLGFDWPMDKPWQGFLMPESLSEQQCPDCAGMGTTPAHQWVAQITGLLLMLDDDVASQQRGWHMHPYFRDTGSRAHAGRPSADIVEFGTGLADRAGGLLGHDAIDNWRATEKVIEAAGLDPKVWGRCPACDGHGSTEVYEGQRAEAEAWGPTEPPTGEGWQLWETVSEGSPISPVFDSADGLSAWMQSDAYQWGVSGPLTKEQADRFVESGWAPSMIFTPETGLVAGEAAVL